MNRKSLAFTALLGTFVLAPIASFASLSNLNSNTDYMFVQTAQAAKIESVKDQPNTFKLTLTHLNPYVSYFSDRPSRTTGLIKTEQFVQYWQTGNNSFKADMPNANLEGVKVQLFGKDSAKTFALSISNPVYDKKDDSMTYTVHPLQGNQNKIPSTANYDYAALFIDGFCMSCIG